ncbi:DNA primase small subunit [Anaeramoeba flamelloides]|uniref:DNA primase n=1 Tax=Anaeramoeba flamelloides TaxID=1746091 RepID=A0ABQ8ZAG8_9EUKA|nr:DNA primase small subunit [Anaeramoeba flamelloides]
MSEEQTKKKLRGNETTKKQITTTNETFSDLPLDTMLKLYYQHIFPVKEMYDWLSIDDFLTKRNYFSRREFAFDTLKFRRHLSYSSPKDLQNQLIQNHPFKIHVGPLYNTIPRDKHLVSVFTPVERELVFDIDLTDYDPVRTCCEGAKICTKCWTLMTVAIKVLDFILRRSFGFKHLLWVYSGRRGVHCWVCDTRARRLSEKSRAALASFINIEVTKSGWVDLRHPMNPVIKKVYNEILVDYFEDLVVDQDFFGDQDQNKRSFLNKFSNNVLVLIRNSELRDRIQQRWTSQNEEKSRWHILKEELEYEQQNLKKKTNFYNRNDNYTKILQVIIFTTIYPRLDIGVSKKLNHLLKSPFSVHTGTENKKICIPINPKECDDFDPTDPKCVPTLIGVVNDLNNSKKNQNLNYNSTDLKKYVDMFVNDFLKPLRVQLEKEHKERILARKKNVMDIENF